jgi:hypothetical protein
MGHQRLGEIPKSHKWQAVVAAVSGGGGGATGSGEVSVVVLRVSMAFDIGRYMKVDLQ